MSEAQTATETTTDTEALSAQLDEARRQLTAQVKLRRDVLKPLELALKALKNPHENALALYEAGQALATLPTELALPAGTDAAIAQVNALADKHLAELEFTFARDLRETFAGRGIELTGGPTTFVADLFVIKPSMRRRVVEITFSRQPVTDKKIKLDVAQVVNAYERAWRDICERNTDYGQLLEDLSAVYERLTKLSSKPLGYRANVVDMYRELILVRQPAGFRKTPSKNSFKDYPKTHFAYDMLQLRRLNKLYLNDVRLNFGTAQMDTANDTTSDTARAMFLATGANEGQFIKDLYFSKE